MCGRFSNTLTWKQIHDLYRATMRAEEDWKPRVNIPPTTQIPVVRNGSVARVDLMKWGLMQTWMKDKPFMATFNARLDSVAEKATFRNAWKKKQRCLIPATSFFEWEKLDSKGKNKQPYAIGLSNKGPLSFAGLWDQCDWDGGTVMSCTILTTEPNALMGKIHDRMPVILGEEDQAKWLAGDDVPMQYPAEQMTLWKVGPAVGKVGNQGPELLEPI